MPTNGTITTNISGVDVAIKVGYYPSPAKATSAQWRVHLPIFEDGEFDHWHMDVLSGFNLQNPKKQAHLLDGTDKQRNDAIIAHVNKQQEQFQAEWDRRHETERDELVMELAEVPEKEARKIELDDIIAAKEVG